MEPSSEVLQREADVKTAVIVGAGPAGVAAAACLARRGWRCEVFERRTEPVVSANERGYPMVLNARSFRTLRLAGLDVPSVGPSAHPRSAWYINTKCMATFPLAEDLDKRQYMVDRALLFKELYLAAVAVKDWGTQGGSIRWHWGKQPRSVDFTARVAVFESSDPSSASGTVSAEYDLLIGADGYNSAVRKELLAAVPSIKADIVMQPCVTYKTFHELQITPAIESAIPGIGSHRCGHCIYMFKIPGIPFFAMWKQIDGTISGLMTSTGSWKAEDLRATLSTQFVTNHPGLAEWVEPIIEATSDNGKQKAAQAGRVIKMSQFHGPSCVLLGDSAHPVTAGLGQGCNMALESVRVFIDTLDNVGLEAAPAAFTKTRLPDVHAFQSMECRIMMMNATGNVKICGVERKPTLVEKMSSMALLMVPSVPRMFLNKLFPKAYPNPNILFAMLSNADAPYREVKRELVLRASTVVAVAGAVGVAAVAAVVALGTQAARRTFA